jgi:hypothetical protein
VCVLGLMWLLRDTAFSNYGPYAALPAFVLSSAFRVTSLPITAMALLERTS